MSKHIDALLPVITETTESHWITSINTWIETQTRRHSAQKIYLPAGETPRPLYKDWVENRPLFLKDLKLIQIDDIVTGPQAGLFKKFFVEALPDYKNQIEFIDEASTQADLALLGLGLNGHVAFHEPGVSIDLWSGCTFLTEKTKTVLRLKEPTWGVTYGLQAFLKTKAIAVIVRGEKKRQSLQKMLSRDRDWPASYLLQHKNISIFTDFIL